MNKTAIMQALRALRRSYGSDDVTLSELTADLAAVRGPGGTSLPPGAKAVAEAAYKNAEKVADGDLTDNQLARIALNTTIGAAKRNVFGF